MVATRTAASVASLLTIVEHPGVKDTKILNIKPDLNEIDIPWTTAVLCPVWTVHVPRDKPTVSYTLKGICTIKMIRAESDQHTSQFNQAKDHSLASNNKLWLMIPLFFSSPSIPFTSS